ncbi:MAG: sigma-54-dependent Fis family transcriptional regulator [Desulfobacteraceae bacterium]|nr:sigma-54-dependent Fis family transcriptional regulator [Desulfobacteraceae bacterium]
MAKVLIIDDDREVCAMLTDLISCLEHTADHALTLEKGLSKAVSGEFDVVFLDVKMPDGSGLDIIGSILAIEFPPEIIVITGQGDSKGAGQAIKNGAWDYIQKPLSPKAILQPLNRILKYRDGIRSISRQAAPLKRKEIIGSSHRIKECLDTIAKAAKINTNVLITGETGTGKELFARAIHANSPRADKRFVVVDCAALPESLVESSLFGHEKGSFTGADRSTRGLVGLSDGGTLFLDEVGEMNLNLQKVFLRVLQERKFRPVGSKHEITSDFRVIAATNRDLAAMVREKRFREDLFYRLKAVHLELPPLRERLEDIEELVRHFASAVYSAQSMAPKELSANFIATLKSYDWPGNVRELVNTLEAAVSEGFYEPALFSKHLPSHIRIKSIQSAIAPKAAPEAERVIEERGIEERPEPSSGHLTYKKFREQVLARAETAYFQDLMKETRGDIKQACTLSGLGRTRLYALLKKHNISRMGWDQ